jgi:hypothetical protein
MEKALLRCRKCSALFHYSLRRNWFFRYVLFFLPVKVYFCAKCAKKRYVWLNKKEAAKYEDV